MTMASFHHNRSTTLPFISNILTSLPISPEKRLRGDQGPNSLDGVEDDPNTEDEIKREQILTKATEILAEEPGMQENLEAVYKAKYNRINFKRDTVSEDEADVKLNMMVFSILRIEIKLLIYGI